MVRGQLHTVSGIDCIPISIYAVPAWIGFLILSREQYGQINAFLNRIYRCGFSCELIVITGSAVALHCVKAHRQSQWRSPNFNPL